MRHFLYILFLLFSITSSYAQEFIIPNVKDVKINFPIGEIKYIASPAPGKITIIGNDGGSSGSGSQIDYPGGKDYTLTDAKGNI